MFRTTGMPPEMAAAVQTSTRAIAEAIVYLLTVKNDLRLISATHYNQLQACHTSS
jgi:DNA mismatch repair ATPase MutS